VLAHFSPKGGCTEAIVREINAARREVLVLAYGFTSQPIAQALVDAKLRGVHVEMVLDHSNEHDAHSNLHFLLEQGVVPLIDAHHGIAHNKVMLVDGRTIITGSFNFTHHAENANAENLLILKHHADLVRAYRQDFDVHKAHARAAEVKVAPAAHGPSHSDEHKTAEATHSAPKEHKAPAPPATPPSPKHHASPTPDEPAAPAARQAIDDALFSALRRTSPLNKPPPAKEEDEEDGPTTRAA
jgi:phosphatidylserine/phosphatidylglycerophosphate/cardiolipin synthase-like enzyme